MKERPSLPRRESRGLRLTPLVVQSSDSRWTAAPHRHQIPDQINRPDRPNAIGPAVPPKDDIVGWPEDFQIPRSWYGKCHTHWHPPQQVQENLGTMKAYLVDARGHPRFKLEVDIRINSRSCGLLKGLTIDMRIWDRSGAHP